MAMDSLEGINVLRRTKSATRAAPDDDRGAAHPAGPAQEEPHHDLNEHLAVWRGMRTRKSFSARPDDEDEGGIAAAFCPTDDLVSTLASLDPLINPRCCGLASGGSGGAAGGGDVGDGSARGDSEGAAASPARAAAQEAYDTAAPDSSSAESVPAPPLNSDSIGHARLEGHEAEGTTAAKGPFVAGGGAGGQSVGATIWAWGLDLPRGMPPPPKSRGTRARAPTEAGAAGGSAAAADSTKDGAHAFDGSQLLGPSSSQPPQTPSCAPETPVQDAPAALALPPPGRQPARPSRWLRKLLSSTSRHSAMANPHN